MDPQLAQTLKFDADGLVPAIVQDATSGEVLMMAWMNKDAIEKTLATGKTHFYSRSRKKMWLKGETSGHLQHVRSISLDCDADVLLVKVAQVGAACHDGYYSCFYREYKPNDETKFKIVGRKVFEPETVYG